MRKKVMAFNAIFCAVFAIMCVASIIGALHLHRDTLYYSALIWALATLLCLRRIQRIKKHEKEQTQSQNTEEK